MIACRLSGALLDRVAAWPSAGGVRPFVEHPRELLREQRVAPGPLGDQLADVGPGAGSEDVVEEQEGLRVAQGRERDHDRVAHPAAPPRIALQHLGSRGAHDQHGEARRPLEHVLDELDHRRLRPVQILDRDHEGADGRDRLEEAAPGAERLRLLDGVRLRVGQADERRETCPEPLLLGGVLDEALDGGGELGVCGGGVVRLEDARLRLHDLPERPVRDALAVGEAAPLPPCRHQVGLIVEVREELADHPALADARLAEQRHELDGRFARGSRERVLQELELVLPPHERGGRAVMELGAEPAVRGLRDPDGERLGLALDLHRVERLVVEEVACEPVRALAHQDPADRGHPLQPGSGVHDVPDRDALRGWLRADRDDGDARLDPDPHGEREVVVGLVELLDHGGDAEGAEDRSLRVVLVRDRGAEHGHHRVADELLDGAAEPFDLAPDPSVIRRERVLDVLGIGEIEARRELDEVAEQDRDDLAFLARAAVGVQRVAAGRTVVRGLRIAMTAGPTDRHGRSVDRAPLGTGQRRSPTLTRFAVGRRFVRPEKEGSHGQDRGFPREADVGRGLRGGVRPE